MHHSGTTCVLNFDLPVETNAAPIWIINYIVFYVNRWLFVNLKKEKKLVWQPGLVAKIGKLVIIVSFSDLILGYDVCHGSSRVVFRFRVCRVAFYLLRGRFLF